MPVQYFLLDNNHADYTAALPALATLDAAKYSFTPTQVDVQTSVNPTTVAIEGRAWRCVDI